MIGAIVLAAGASRRFGAHKLLQPVHGRALLHWSVERILASPVDEVVVVLGRQADEVGRELRGLPVRLVHNPAYAAGMSTSLRAGLHALSPRARAALVALGDQPLLDTGLVPALLELRRASGRPIVAPSYAGARGHPVLFDASLFPEIRRVRGDVGARAVVERDPSRVALLPLPSPPPPDVDTPADLQALLRELATGA